ncbi:MAG: serine hydrolase, partial [Sediminibacterium sp.]|nr:serine hydrolase [Sediminibacterium sp.]
LVLILISIGLYTNSQTNKLQQKWVDNEFKKLSADEKIAQLFIIRTHSNWDKNKIDSILAIIKKYNVGGICFFQGDPVNQAIITNQFQQATKTPLLISIDAEWGLGMRLNNVINFPKNMQLGALDTSNKQLVYKIGMGIAKQCNRLGIQLNYAPVADINNNPLNPVINDRSFGEDKYKVSLFATQLMQGLQENGVMACAKHFPGHGDVDVDSHLDLPQINKSIDSLNQFELYPFKTLINKGIQAVMVAHLFVPSVDSQKNKPSSLSENTIQKLLKKELQFNGLVITDALEMNAIKNYYPDNTAATQAIIAGNDLLCLPADLDGTIKQVKLAIQQNKINWKTIN